MFTFDRINLLVNGSGILAESASLSSNNQLEPIYQVGKRGITSISPAGPARHVFSFSYIPVLNYDPPYIMSSGLKNLVNDLHITGETIELAGITGFNCYLQNYSLRVEPNQILRAQCSYITYNPLSGIVRVKSDVPTMNPTNPISWGATSFVNSTGYYLTTPTYSLDYNFSAEFAPIYTFGNACPIQVNFMGANENITFARDNFIFVYFSGKDAYNSEPNYFVVNSGVDDPFISLIDIAFTCFETNTDIENRFASFIFNISGAKITNSELNARIDDYLRSTTSIVNYY